MSQPVFLFRRFVAVCLVLTLALPAAAQRDEVRKKPDDGKWREDPYTKNEGEALRKAGYERFGPIVWNEGVTSDRVEQALGEVKIRWIETEHFRLGCALEKWKIPGDDREVKKRIKAELTRLAKRIPRVKSKIKTKQLDPWLRAHLYAQRLEELYDDLSKLLGVTDRDFPAAGTKPGKNTVGRGPHLGVKGKFNVLLLHKDSDCARFVNTFTDADPDGPRRWYYSEPADNFLFVTAVEFSGNAYEDDTALYCHVAFNVLHNMLDAYRGFSYQTTIWWQEGLTHCLRRDISDEWNSYSSIADDSERVYRMHDWENRVLGRLKNGLHRPIRDLAERFSYEGLKFADHMELWSRADFLRARSEKGFGRFITILKSQDAPFGKDPEKKQQLALQEEALQECFGLTWDSFDEEWIRWAKKEYRGKK